MNHTISFHLLLATILLAFPAGSLTAQTMGDAEPPAEFTIELALRDNLVSMTCQGDCSWKKLTFSLEDKVAGQLIDQNGMLNRDDEREMTDEGFLLDMSVAGNKLTIEGLRGTDFSMLTTTCGRGCSATITRSGIESRPE